MKHRLVVVSNRVGPLKDTRRAGGLAIALIDALRDHGGLWFGWSGQISERVRSRPRVQSHGTLTQALLDLTPEDYEAYYNGFANTSLWPLFHYWVCKTQFDRDHYEGYLRVNRRFAGALSRLLKRHDLIWVHDYHFIPFAAELRRAGHQQPMGFFLHIPFPAPEVLTVLPTHAELVRALFAYDLIGFQTEADRRAFLEYVVGVAGGAIHPDDQVTAFGRTVVAAVFPIGIDPDGFSALFESKEAQSQFKRLRQALGGAKGRTQILGVDRLDYTKGLPQRFHAYERLLRSYPENRGQVSMIQLAPLSRVDAHGYAEIREELVGIAGSINARYAGLDWTPLRYINRSYSRRSLVGIYRASRVALVTPLRDGMNLVAKEYVAAQDPRDPGVLVLSCFAGAARQLHEALIVNPYDLDALAEAMQKAIAMPLAERRRRWGAMMATLREYDIHVWRERFIARLTAAESAGHPT